MDFNEVKDLVQQVRSMCFYIRKTGSFSNSTEFYNNYCPNVSDYVRNGLLLPPSALFTTPAGEEYFEHLQLNDLTGLQAWIQILGKMIKNKVDFSKLQSLYDTLFEIAAGHINITTYEIPCVLKSALQFTFDRHYIKIQTAGIWEYCKYRRLIYIQQFYDHVLQILLFGFPIEEDIIAHLGVVNVKKYVYGRILQGELEYMNNTTNENVTSNFLNEYSPMYVTNDEAIVDALTTIPNEMSVKSIQNLHHTIVNSHFLGSSSKFISTLVAQNMYGSKLPHSYRNYLKKDSKFLKIGPTLYKELYNSYDMDEMSYRDKSKTSATIS